MSLDRLNKIVTKAAKALYDNEKFLAGTLAAKASQVVELFPNDQTSISMSNFLSKRASKEAFVTRAELKDVYNRLYTYNNKFAEHFAEELGASEVKTPHVMQHQANESTDLVQEAFDKYADPVLSNALASAFDGSLPYKPYSNETAKQAEKSCAHALNVSGAPPKVVDAVSGNENLIVCKASYDTSVGNGYVLVPVEVRANKALVPSLFVTAAGLMNIEQDAIKDHLVRTAGKQYKVDVQNILAIGSLAPLDGVEQALMRVKNAELDEVHEAPVKEFKEIEYEQPAEVQEMAKRLTSSAGVAEFTLGSDVVQSGRSMIRYALNQWGFKNPQVAVSASDEDTIFYAVSVDNRAGFTVPVKVANGNAVEPTMILHASSIVEFSNEGVSEVLSSEDHDIGAMAKASPMYDLKPSDLVGQVRQAMLDKNYVKAEEALTILRMAGDDKAYRVGFELYSAGLAGKIEKEESTCSKQLKTAHSKHVICGHTNLPIHKVYQDKNGDCRPMYRRGMAESGEGGYFMDSKIYLG